MSTGWKEKASPSRRAGGPCRRAQAPAARQHLLFVFSLGMRACARGAHLARNPYLPSRNSRTSGAGPQVDRIAQKSWDSRSANVLPSRMATRGALPGRVRECVMLCFLPGSPDYMELSPGITGSGSADRCGPR